MNILFLTLVEFNSIKEHNIYTDLLREFAKNGHKVFAISPLERKHKQKTYIIRDKNFRIIRLKIGNIQKTNIFEKGISMIRLESQYKKAIKRYFSKIKFNLILYSTPPITLVSAVEYVKKRDNALTYLLLKDIFPQNALDIGLLSQKGIKGVLYRFFRKKEKKLYRISDRIGCMSKANVEYIINHNPDINRGIVEICPNSIDVIDKSVNKECKNKIRTKYGIPMGKKVFVYGGNLGKPQGIPFLTQCLKKCSKIDDVFFLIVGGGTEYGILEEYVNRSRQSNLKLMKQLPKEDYDTMVGACDVGMIFLDYRFTIPNFPSRLLSYMQAKLPVLAVTDSNTDVGSVITKGGFGWSCESDNSKAFYDIINAIIKEDKLLVKGEKGFSYLKEHYSVDQSYHIIYNSINRNNILG